MGKRFVGYNEVMDNCEKPKCDPCMGIKPTNPAAPKTCKKKCGCSFVRVTIPSSLGDDTTGQMLPSNGLYANAIVVYEANDAQYLYDSDGVFTKLGQATGGGSGRL